jgi:hypothetical protein
MFEPAECFKASLVLFLGSYIWWHNVAGSVVLGGIPFAFGVFGWFEGG